MMAPLDDLFPIGPVRRRRAPVLAAGSVAVILLPILAWAAPSQHKVFVTFDYDFTIERPCKDKETGTCVKRFIIYDITDPNAPLKLFSIAVDPKVKKMKYRVKGESNLLQLSDGMHTLAATAQWANGAESDPKACTTRLAVRPQQVKLDLKMERQSGK
jgi:hypothetical protein